MNEERVQILQMLQDGKINVDEATRLLEAAEMPKAATQARSRRFIGRRWRRRRPRGQSFLPETKTAKVTVESSCFPQ